MCVWQTQSLWVPHMCIFNLRLFFTSHFLFSDSPIPAFTIVNFLSCLVLFSPSLPKMNAHSVYFSSDLSTIHQESHLVLGFVCACVKLFYYQFSLQLYIYWFSISSWVSCGCLCLSRNVSLSYKSPNVLLHWCSRCPLTVLFSLCGT